jgi:hypothetical protein
MVINSIRFDSKDGRYLLACARIRGVSIATLVSRLMSVISQDQLVLAILDDESQPAMLKRGEHRFKDTNQKELR